MSGAGDAVLVGRQGRVGILSLNRPRAIHALTLPMVRAMTAALLDWRDDDGVEVILIDHAPAADGDPRLSRGFCAGGDIAMLRQSALEDGGAAGRQFFYEEYRLNHLIHTYAKPVVAFMDGITMGGGVGISQPARFRVATPNTRLAMPETGIGLFPDVGGGWYLSRLAGGLGIYLGLVGARLDGAECLWAGLATHYLPHGALGEAKARIAAGEAPGEVLDALAAPPPEAGIAAHAPAIARHFRGDDADAIAGSLAGDGGAWAMATLALLGKHSPLACKVTLEQLTRSAKLDDFAANMAMEYRLASRMAVGPDFIEGVRALIVEKDNAPRWAHAGLEDVGPDAVAAMFAPLPDDREWTPL